jgi:hypothetical protein
MLVSEVDWKHQVQCRGFKKYYSLLFYKITLDIVGPFPKTIDGNKYILIAIDDYSSGVRQKLYMITQQ